MDSCLNRIMELLEIKNIQNKELTKYLGVPASTVSDWKSGKMSSYRKYITQISEFLDVSPDYLLGKSQFLKNEPWNALVIQYQLSSKDSQNFVNRLLSIKPNKANSLEILPLSEEEDLTTVIELIKIFDKLNIVGKSRVIITAAEELEKENSKS